eukprot:6790502-Ditylum_brightwellii.AAC.1
MMTDANKQNEADEEQSKESTSSIGNTTDTQVKTSMPLSTPTPPSSNINSSNVAVYIPSLHQDEKEDNNIINKDDNMSVQQQHQQLERDCIFPTPKFEYDNNDTYSINSHTSGFSNISWGCWWW